MQELIFLKLGGSLLTDKTRVQTVRAEVLRRLCAEIAGALADLPDWRLLIGHGSGSFGHVVASRHRTRAGVHSVEQWRGFAATAVAAGQLNHIVVDALSAAGVPVLPIQPSASAVCRDGELASIDERPIRAALDHGLVPVVYGDVALDETRGGTIISTEEIFRWLACRLAPQRIVLAGEAPGVLRVDPRDQALDDPELAGQVIAEITAADLPQLDLALGSSRGIDVTGGMFSKVREMVGLVESTPSLGSVQLISGLVPGLLSSVLAGQSTRSGTTIRRAGAVES